MSKIKNQVKKKIISFLESNTYKSMKDTKRRVMSSKYNEKFEKFKDKKKIVYTLSPEHGNLGDQAIAYASLKFLKDTFSDYEIIELERDEIFKYYKPIKKILRSDDIIVLHGGGNLGNLYIQEENARRFIIKNFKENKILSMTQTISFSDDEEGRRELETTKRIYNANSNLTLLAREDKSYNTMKKVFTNTVIEVPDIVFYLEDIFEDNLKDRNGIMTCLRADKESIWKDKKEVFINELKANNENVFCYDTVVPLEINNDIRKRELYDIWNKYRSHKVVITDRLHGMIFAYVTKTPCIVLKSLDHKVVESYRWIEGIKHIKLVSDLDYCKIEPLLKEMLSVDSIEAGKIKSKYYPELMKKFNEIVKCNNKK